MESLGSKKETSEKETSETLEFAQFGDYHLLSVLGRGGMATVYFAELRRGEHFRRKVALKVISEAFSRDANYRRWFQREAMLGGCLTHANIVATSDQGEVNGRLFLVMDYIDGPTLSTVIKAARALGEQLQPYVIISVLQQVLQGLHYAHHDALRDGVPINTIHRDLKPSNILLEQSGIAKVADFGVAYTPNLAEMFGGSSTLPNVPRGTYQYMSPEQLKGSPLLDHRSDLFSVGLIMGELALLEPFYSADSVGKLMVKVEQGDVEEPLARLANSPYSAFLPIITRALTADREQRFQTAQQMLDALEQLRVRWTSLQPFSFSNYLKELGIRLRAHPELAQDLDNHWFRTSVGNVRIRGSNPSGAGGGTPGGREENSFRLPSEGQNRRVIIMPNPSPNPVVQNTDGKATLAPNVAHVHTIADETRQVPIPANPPNVPPEPHCRGGGIPSAEKTLPEIPREILKGVGSGSRPSSNSPIVASSQGSIAGEMKTNPQPRAPGDFSSGRAVSVSTSGTRSAATVTDPQQVTVPVPVPLEPTLPAPLEPQPPPGVMPTASSKAEEVVARVPDSVGPSGSRVPQSPSRPAPVHGGRPPSSPPRSKRFPLWMLLAVLVVIVLLLTILVWSQQRERVVAKAVTPSPATSIAPVGGVGAPSPPPPVVTPSPPSPVVTPSPPSPVVVPPVAVPPVVKPPVVVPPVVVPPVAKPPVAVPPVAVPPVVKPPVVVPPVAKPPVVAPPVAVPQVVAGSVVTASIVKPPVVAPPTPPPLIPERRYCGFESREQAVSSASSLAYPELDRLRLCLGKQSKDQAYIAIAVIQSDHPSAYGDASYELGKAYFELGEYDNCLKALERAFKKGFHSRCARLEALQLQAEATQRHLARTEKRPPRGLFLEVIDLADRLENELENEEESMGNAKEKACWNAVKKRLDALRGAEGSK